MDEEKGVIGDISKGEESGTASKDWLTAGDDCRPNGGGIPFREPNGCSVLLPDILHAPGRPTWTGGKVWVGLMRCSGMNARRGCRRLEEGVFDVGWKDSGDKTMLGWRTPIWHHIQDRNTSGNLKEKEGRRGDKKSRCRAGELGLGLKERDREHSTAQHSTLEWEALERSDRLCEERWGLCVG